MFQERASGAKRWRRDRANPGDPPGNSPRGPASTSSAENTNLPAISSPAADNGWIRVPAAFGELGRSGARWTQGLLLLRLRRPKWLMTQVVTSWQQSGGGGKGRNKGRNKGRRRQGEGGCVQLSFGGKKEGFRGELRIGVITGVITKMKQGLNRGLNRGDP